VTSIQQRVDFGSSAPAEDAGHRVMIMQTVSVAVIALMAFAAYVTLDGAIRIQQSLAAQIERIDRQSALFGRLTNLVAQEALGDVRARRELSEAVNAFESAPLDAASAAYVAQARRIAAMSPHDPALAAHTAPQFLASQAPLQNAFNSEARESSDRANGQLSALRIMGAVICTIVLATLAAGWLAVFGPMARRLVRLVRDAHELAGLATIDPLTGMLNKRSFQARGAIEINKARRYGRPLSLLMIDADQLTAIEDQHGRDGGDKVLQALTTSFFGGTRISDLVARVDAEQFAILLPETSCEGAQLLAERLRHKVSDLTVEIDRKVVACTISVGVACAEKDASFLWPTFKRADEALYEAKMRGRNRVVVAAAA
jgi:diguanylate cyclase (GGDEF)-like protein